MKKTNKNNEEQSVIKFNNNSDNVFEDSSYITAVLIQVINDSFGKDRCGQCEDWLHKVSARFCNNLHPSVRWEEFVEGCVNHLRKLGDKVVLSQSNAADGLISTTSVDP